MTGITVSVLGGMIVAIIGAIGGWALGRLTVLTEMRFKVLQTASTAYFRAIIAIREFQDAKFDLDHPYPPEEARSQDKAQLDRVVGRAERTRALLVEIVAASHLLAAVFGSETEKRWAVVNERLKEFEDEDRAAWIKRTVEAFTAFADEARRECGFRWWIELRERILKWLPDILTAGKWRQK